MALLNGSKEVDISVGEDEAVAESASNVEDVFILLPLKEYLSQLFYLRTPDEVLAALSELITTNSHQPITHQPEETELQPTRHFPHFLALQNNFRGFYLIHDLFSLGMPHALNLILRSLPASIHIKPI